MELDLLLFIQLFDLFVLSETLVDWELGCLVFDKKQVAFFVSELACFVNFDFLKLVFIDLIFFMRSVFGLEVLFLDDSLGIHLLEFLFMFDFTFIKLFEFTQLWSQGIIGFILGEKRFFYCEGFGGWRLFFCRCIFVIGNRRPKNPFEIFVVGRYKINVFWHPLKSLIIKITEKSSLII